MSESGPCNEQLGVKDAAGRYGIQVSTQREAKIPTEWPACTLDSWVSFLSGGTPSKNDRSFWGGSIPWVSSKDMKTALIRDSIDHVTDQAIGRGTRMVAAGTILVVVRGMSLLHSLPIGLTVRPVAFNQDIKALVPENSVVGLFLLYWMQANSAQILALATEATHGTKRLPTSDLRRLEVSFPALDEQRVIATALSDADALIDALDRLIAKKRAIKQAAQQQLLTGQTRLPGFGVHQSLQAGESPAVELLNTDIGMIPKDWKSRRLRTLLKAAPGYGINAPACPFNDSLPAYLRITDISDDGRFEPKPQVSVLADDAYRYLLDTGDIVFARTGASVGKSYEYKLSDGPLVFAGFLIRVTPDPDELDTTFLANYCQTDKYWSWVKTISTRSGQPGINSAEYGSLFVPVPSINEQRSIATVLADMDAEIEALQHRRDKARQIKQGMMQQLLTGRVRLVGPVATKEASEC